MFRNPIYFENESFELQARSSTKNWFSHHLSLDRIKSYHLTGHGVRVAVIDSGANYEHPVFGNQLEYKPVHRNYTIGSHGTAVCSIIKGNGYKGVYGIAPEAEVLSINGLGSGASSAKTIVRAVEIAMDWKADIINMSFGSNRAYKKFIKVIEKALGKDILIVAAGGNSGTNGGVMWAAKHPDVLSVGSVNQALLISPFSSREDIGDIDIVAPGEYIPVAVNGNDRTNMSGTSFSSPIVSGLAACIKQAGIKLSPQLFKDYATDLFSPGEDAVSGFGLVNAIDILRDHEGI